MLSPPGTITWCRNGTISRLRLLRGDAAVHEFDHVDDHVGFGGFEQQSELAMGLAVALHGTGGIEDAFGAERSAGTEAAVEFVEVAFGPTGEDFGIGVDDFLDHRIRAAVEQAMQQERRILKQFVGGDAQAVGEAVERAGVGTVDSGEDAFDGAFVETGARDDIVQGKALASHEAAEIGGVVGHDANRRPNVSIEKTGARLLT
jgi:hypothetical protein